MDYPELYYPKEIDAIFNATPSKDSPPREPIIPKLPTRPVQNTGKKVDEDAKTYGCFFAVAVICLVIFIVASSKGKVEIGGILLCLFMAIILGIFFFSKLNGRNDYKEEYPKKLIEYENELKKYPEVLRKYNIDVKNYKIELKKHQQEGDKLVEKSVVQLYRKKILFEFLLKAKIPVYVNERQIKKGVSERYFRDLLEKKFGKRIFSTFCLKINDSAYYPDIVYWETEDNILIDIEIDEPYIGATGEPIHYLRNDGYGKTFDEKRNEEFIKNRWFVIRFAEEQIFKFPQQCVSKIEQIISMIKNIESISNVSINDKTTIKKWSKETAHRMAFHRYRHKYLPNNLQSLIVEETFDELTRNKYTEKNYEEGADVPF